MAATVQSAPTTGNASNLQPARKTWQTIGAEKRQEIFDRIAPWIEGMDLPTADIQPNGTKVPATVLSKEELHITEDFDAERLVTSLARGDLKAVDVTKAFCKRASVAHAMTNCLSEVMFDQAVQRAQELDEHLEKTGVPVGPLHGLPISLKDQFRVAGTAASVGYVSWLSKIDTPQTESWLVKKLRDAGAIFYVKTNVPTSLMAIETNNNTIGYTWNPYNRKLSSGGSSGGEGALLGMKGSIVGLGSDIGASVRYPAGINGVYGLKTSIGRLPYMGVANSMEGQEANPSTIGPMARSLKDLDFMMRRILALSPWLEDPKCLPIAWREGEESLVNSKVASTGLTIGVLTTGDELGYDGIVKCHPPVSRVMRETVDKLQAAGHHVIPFTPPAHSEGFQILFECLASDGGVDIHRTLTASGEPPVPQVAVSYGNSLGHLEIKNLNQWWELQQRKYNYQQRYLEYWNSTASQTRTGNPVDAVLLPLGPSASFEKDKGFYFGYTGIGNLIDVSAAAVPMDKASKAKDVLSETDKQYKPISDLDSSVWNSYEPATYDGTPVAVQIWTRKLEEEKALAIAKEVEKVASVFEP